MPSVTIGKYTFRYDETGVYHVKTHAYNFADTDCQTALQEAIEQQSKYAAKFYHNQSRAAFVYIGTGIYGDGVYKIGSSYDPESRYSNGLQTILFTIEVATRREAFRLETGLHNRFIDKRYKHRASVKKEWFALSADDLNYIRELAQKG